jgi:hypothetical protein
MELVRHLEFQTKSAFEVAVEIYSRYPEMDIWTDLVHYMRHGFVITRPHLFGMVELCEYDGEACWFIQIIVGNLLEAISCLPFKLSKLIFTRDNKKGLCVVDTKRLIELAKQCSKNRID